MRKNRMIVTLAIAAAVMMAVTACGSKKTASTETTTEAVTEQTDTTAEKSTEGTTTTEASSEETTEETTESAEETTEESTEETTPEAGEVKSDGSFAPSNGRYTVTPPAGWSLDEGSDENYATFLPENGDDMLELMYLTGGDSESMVELLPATAEEYKQYISRDGNLDIVKYDVKVKDDGSQTFSYAVRYNDPSDGVYYLAVSGIYDAAKKEYIAATGTVMSEGEDIIKAVQAAVDSFQIK